MRDMLMNLKTSHSNAEIYAYCERTLTEFSCAWPGRGVKGRRASVLDEQFTFGLYGQQRDVPHRGFSHVVPFSVDNVQIRIIKSSVPISFTNSRPATGQFFLLFCLSDKF